MNPFRKGLGDFILYLTEGIRTAGRSPRRGDVGFERTSARGESFPAHKPQTKKAPFLGVFCFSRLDLSLGD